MTFQAQIRRQTAQTSNHQTERKTRKGWLSATSWGAALGAAVVAFSIWAGADRPVTNIAPYSGQIGGFAFSPFHAGETPEKNEYPTTAQIKSDLTLVAQHTKNIRTLHR